MASLVCDSNPVVASQTRFAVYRMKRRICANLNLTYSQSMELGLSPDMFFKWIGGVFPTEIRSCFRVLCPCLCDGRFMSFTAKRRICARLNIARGEILSLSKICTHAKLFANLTTRFADSLPARKY